MKKFAITLGLGLVAVFGAGPSASAQPVPTLGQVMTTAAMSCPVGWMPMEGQLLAVSHHQALFSLLGTVYGGDGKSSFALPDGRGRTIVGAGSGANLPAAREGQTNASGAAGSGGTPVVTLRMCIAIEGRYPPR